MVLYITTWQEVPDDNQKDTMTTKPEWFIEFENKQEQRWKEQQEFNQKVVKFMSDQDKLIQQILSLVQSMINRVENIEHRLDKLESRIDNLVAKNNLKE